MKFTLAICIFLASLLGASAQINVTNYGVKGDYLTFTNVSVTSNSTAIVGVGTTWTQADSNKLMMIYNASFYRGQSNETLVAQITNVTDGTHLKVSFPAQTTMTNLQGALWTDNRPGFSNVLAAAAFPTDTIIFPAGNYGFGCSNIDDFWCSGIILTRGGLTFQGQGTATLTGMGGWRNTTVATVQGAAPVGRRGPIIVMVTPTTNNSPTIFTNLVFNGGTLQGVNGGGNNGPSTNNGETWDISHHAFVVANYQGSQSMMPDLAFNNCICTKWRGEVLIGTTVNVSNRVTIANSLFYDNNASAWNFPYSHDYGFCVVSNMDFGEEYYAFYSTNALGSSVHDCLFTNCFGTLILGIGGGVPTMPTFTYTNNDLYLTNGQQGIATVPANNLVIRGNRFTGMAANSGSAITVGNSAGYIAGIGNSNFMIADNFFTNMFRCVQTLGGNSIAETNGCYSIIVSNNYSVGDNIFGLNSSYSFNQNVIYTKNHGSYLLNISITNSYNPIDAGDNTWTPPSAGAGKLLYSDPNGCCSVATFYSLVSGSSNYYLDITNSVKWVAPGSVFSMRGSAAGITLYTNDALSGTSFSVASGQTNQFVWTGTAWYPGTVAPIPPVVSVGVYLPILR